MTYHHQYGFPAVGIRPFNIYGPRQVGEGAVHHFIVRALKGEPLTVHNDGSQIRAWCYIDDIVDAVERVLVDERAVGHSFNIGNPRSTVTIYNLAREIIRLSSSGSRIEHVEWNHPDVELRVPARRQGQGAARLVAPRSISKRASCAPSTGIARKQMSATSSSKRSRLAEDVRARLLPQEGARRRRRQLRPSSTNEIFGFLGPNGAGKTTTLKMLMGLIFPTRGQARIFGQPDRRPRGQAAPRLPAGEPLLLRLPVGRGAARPDGAPVRPRSPRARASARARCSSASASARAGDLPLRKYSKGMLQRLGIAQALDQRSRAGGARRADVGPRSHRPQGDPRPHRRAASARARRCCSPRTSSPTSSCICDRVAIVVGGRMRDVGPLDAAALAAPARTPRSCSTKDGASDGAAPRRPTPTSTRRCARRSPAASRSCRVTPRRESLEDLFVREVDAADVGGGAERVKPKRRR